MDLYTFLKRLPKVSLHVHLAGTVQPSTLVELARKTAVDGIIAGSRDARTDFGIQCFLIAAINCMGTPELGLEMVQMVLAHPREEVIGIGMDYAEAEHPPEQFWKAYRLAGQRRNVGHINNEYSLTVVLVA